MLEISTNLPNYLITKSSSQADCRMASEPRKQSMAWMETDYSKPAHFRWKIKWRLEHLGALGIVGQKAPLKEATNHEATSSIVLYAHVSGMLYFRQPLNIYSIQNRRGNNCKQHISSLNYCVLGGGVKPLAYSTTHALYHIKLSDSRNKSSHSAQRVGGSPWSGDLVQWDTV